MPHHPTPHESHEPYPECAVCGVSYTAASDGRPCQELAPHASDAQLLSANPPLCPGTVSYWATATRLATTAATLAGEHS